MVDMELGSMLQFLRNLSYRTDDGRLLHDSSSADTKSSRAKNATPGATLLLLLALHIHVYNTGWSFLRTHLYFMYIPRSVTTGLIILCAKYNSCAS